jgi:hypothetical protein
MQKANGPLDDRGKPGSGGVTPKPDGNDENDSMDNETEVEDSELDMPDGVI